MRLVTQIEELSRSRSRVYVENEFAFVLYKGELRRYHIRENEAITEEEYQTILTQVLPKRAKLRAMHLLKSREYTQKQLMDKLKQQYYPEDIIKEAVAYVEGYHYIDDERYTRDFISGQIEKKSRRRIEEDLARKGISRELTETIFQELEPEELQQAEYGKIKKLLEKKKYNFEDAGYDEEQRMMAFLCRKGFSAEMVRTVMRQREEAF